MCSVTFWALLIEGGAFSVCPRSLCEGVEHLIGAASDARWSGYPFCSKIRKCPM